MVETTLNASGVYDDERSLWTEYAESPSVAIRNRIIERYSEFARMHAARLYADRQIQEIEFDEYRQYALIGLMEAIDRYDPSRGVLFRTYASHRIRGAILSGIEKWSEKQQQIALRTRLREERMQSLLSEVGPEENDPFYRLVNVTIGTAIAYMLEGSSLYQGDGDTYQQNIYRGRELEDLIRVIKDLVNRLPAREQMVVRYHYFQQVRFEEIASKMSLSKGRISQIHRRAMERLRDSYDDLQLLRTDF